jgi:hypothetical protein
MQVVMEAFNNGADFVSKISRSAFDQVSPGADVAGVSPASPVRPARSVHLSLRLSVAAVCATSCQDSPLHSNTYSHAIGSNAHIVPGLAYG